MTIPKPEPTAYTVQKLATLAGVSVRTLHHYDEVGLLKPARILTNGYRQYGEAELLRLQQIMFFRELEFPLDEIRRILDNPKFDMAAALKDHRAMIELKRKRLEGLMQTIDDTLKKLTKHTTMSDKDLYNNFSMNEIDEYADEARERWGHTDAYKQSVERMSRKSKAEIEQMKKDFDVYMKILAETAPKGATSPEFQKLVAQHYESLRQFYEPNLQMYRGMATMFVDDPRFAATYDKYMPGLAVIMRDGMLYFADRQEGK